VVPIILDFESFYSDDYTLSKSTTEAYIRDKRFEAHGAAIKWSPRHEAKWYAEKELRYVLAEHDWSDSFLICHHQQFDGLILSHHYGVHSAKRGCTLSMARLMLGNHIGVSLDSVRGHFGIPLKKTPYNLFKGKHWHEMTPDVQQQVADGCCDEVESIWRIFCRLMGDNQAPFPAEELEVIDCTMRMFCEPVLQANTELLAQIWEREATQKEARLEALDIDVAELQSADKFQALLEAEGVEIEYKDGKSGQIPQFAKNDLFMQELLQDEDDRVRGLAEARIGAKSTLLQTRAETLGFMSQRGNLCVYLKMYAAHTTRWGGGDKSNFQNFKKSDPDFPTNDEPLKIVDAILPPEGYYLAKPDASQIECRLVNFLAGQEDKVEDFRQGRDPYIGVASQFCGYPVNKKDHPNQRQVGKVIELQAGFGSGGEKIRATLRTKAKIFITLAEGVKARDAYRDTHPAVVDYWKAGGRMIKHLANGTSTEWGPMAIHDKRIWLPNGMPLIYDTLEWHIDPEDGDRYWRLRSRKGWVKTYGAKIVENVVQALARLIISQAMIRIARMGYRIVSTEHDSLWILIPKDGREQEHLERCKAEMVRPLPWLPGLPLACEGELQ
jgi:DNA polymerase